MSCETSQHIITAYNYIHNFRVLYGESELTKRLMERCAMRRTMIEEKICGLHLDGNITTILEFLLWVLRVIYHMVLSWLQSQHQLCPLLVNNS